MDSKNIKDICNKIINDVDYVQNIEDMETALKLTRAINPLASIVTPNESHANISVINWREKYMKRVLTTALVGYLYRTCEEFEPEAEIEAEESQFKKSLEGLGATERAAAKSAHEKRTAELTKVARQVIRRFLNRNFAYNPDRHLRTATSEATDESRAKLRAEFSDALADAERIDGKLRQKQDHFYKFTRERLLETYQSVLEATEATKAALSALIDPVIDVEDKQGILFKKYHKLYQLAEELKSVAEPLAQADTLAALKVTPPVDVYHHLDRYLVNHYEQVRQIVEVSYNEQPDIEFAVIYYDSFKTAEEARAYRVKHESEFKTDVYTVQNNGVTLLGPFKENRQRLDFYNKNTEILKRMDEQLAADHRLGEDIMKKRKMEKKRKNILEAGPDAPELANYTSAMNIVSELGKKPGLTKEELERLDDAKKRAMEIAEDYMIPEDAIQLDMLIPQTSENGEVTGLRRAKLYTQAEAPLHMQDGSEYHEKYQPVRSDNVNLSDTVPKKKTIVSKSGQKMEVHPTPK